MARGRSEEELDRGQRRVAIEDVDALQPDLERAVDEREMMEDRADIDELLVATGLGVVELGARHIFVARGVDALDLRPLQQMVTAAFRPLREGGRRLQP